MKPRLNRSSIMEGFDQIDSGLCFALSNGTPLLMNECFKTIAAELRPDCKDLNKLNILDFWNSITEASRRLDNLWEDIGIAPILKLADSYLTFSKTLISVEGEQVYQIIATDTTDLHRIGARIAADNKELEELNERLRRHSDNIDEISKQEEILATKISIHDELGELLLGSKYCLTQDGGAVDIDTVISNWRKIETLLQKDNSSDISDPEKQILDAAEAVGISMVLTGSLPKDDINAMKLIFAASRECLTNAVKHAEADEMWMDIETDRYGYFISITNNGKAPKKPIIEGGGLGGLRKNVEAAGGILIVEWMPEFALKMKLLHQNQHYPEERKRHD